MEKNKSGQPVIGTRIPGWVPFALLLVICLVAGFLVRGMVRGTGGELEISPTAIAAAVPVTATLKSYALDGVGNVQACEETMQREGSNSYYFGQYLNAGVPKYGCIILLNEIWVER